MLLQLPELERAIAQVGRERWRKTKPFLERIYTLALIPLKDALPAIPEKYQGRSLYAGEETASSGSGAGAGASS